jgi:hypothetical protein
MSPKSPRRSYLSGIENLKGKFGDNIRWWGIILALDVEGGATCGVSKRLCGGCERHTSHVTRQISHATLHTSHVKYHTLHVSRHKTCHKSHVTLRMSNATCHTAHLHDDAFTTSTLNSFVSGGETTCDG